MGVLGVGIPVRAYLYELDRHRLPDDPVPLGGVPTRPRGRAEIVRDTQPRCGRHWGIRGRRGPVRVMMTG